MTRRSIDLTDLAGLRQRAARACADAADLVSEFEAIRQWRQHHRALRGKNRAGIALERQGMDRQVGPHRRAAPKLPNDGTQAGG
jgi:hypothetical protein